MGRQYWTDWSEPIHFRAWDVDHKCFVYLDLNNPEEGLFGRHGIIQNTVLLPWQQFTGLHEKWRSTGDKGKRIYADDIVEVSTDVDNFLSKVYWSFNGVRVKTPDGNMHQLSHFEQYTVRGNIHETPELLKAGQEKE